MIRYTPQRVDLALAWWSTGSTHRSRDRASDAVQRQPRPREARHGPGVVLRVSENIRRYHDVGPEGLEQLHGVVSGWSGESRVAERG